MDPDLSVYIKSLKDQVAAERTALREMSAEGRKDFLKSGERLNEIRNSMPPGAELAICPAVSPNVFKIGKTIYDKIKSISKDSINMKFYGFQLLVSVSIPWTGYNILTRKAQTNIVDKFYFRFLGLMHGTTKINYQELSLFYAVVRSFMPQTAFDVLYKKMHLVYTASEKATDANDALDGGVESGIILDSKTSNINNPSVVENSIYWLQSRAAAKNVLKNQLDPSRVDTVFHSDADKAFEATGRKRDREKATAINVAHMLEFLTEKEWLGESHIASPFLCDVLSESPAPIKDFKFVKQLVEADKNGIEAASMHLCCKLGGIFGDLTDEERSAHFGNKPMGVLRNHWKKKVGSFVSMAEHLFSTTNSLNNSKGFKKNPKASMVIEKMHRRYRSIMSMRRDLDKVAEDLSVNPTRRLAARNMKRKLDEHSHVQCEKAYSFRKDLESNEPFREPRVDSFGFFSTLQEELHRLGVFTESPLFLEREPRAVEKGIASLYLDITADVRRFCPTEAMGIETVDLGGAVFAKMRRKMIPYVTSERYSDLVDLHIHVDVERLIPVQVLPERRGLHKKVSQTKKNLDLTGVSQSGRDASLRLQTASMGTHTLNEVRQPENTGDVKPSIGNTSYSDDKYDELYCGTRTILSQNRSAITSSPDNFQFITYLHAVQSCSTSSGGETRETHIS